MRNLRPIDALFPKTRQGIMAATYGQPDRWWYLSELAQYLQTTPSSLQRELKSLVASGLLRERRDGKRLYFQTETKSPIFAPLREIFEQTLGAAAALEDALVQVEKDICVAFIYGSVARAEDHTMSDVDLLVVGSIGLSVLSPIMQKLEQHFNREFNVTCYSRAEFSEKIQSQNHFLTNILRKEKMFLIGGQDDLDGLAQK